MQQARGEDLRGSSPLPSASLNTGCLAESPNREPVLELMIPPHYRLGGAVVAPPSRLGWSRVRTPVWPYFSLPTA
jgi:hypothetical protein